MIVFFANHHAHNIIGAPARHQISDLTVVPYHERQRKCMNW
jgi:hypothetical protein